MLSLFHCYQKNIQTTWNTVYDFIIYIGLDVTPIDSETNNQKEMMCL